MLGQFIVTTSCNVVLMEVDGRTKQIVARWMDLVGLILGIWSGLCDQSCGVSFSWSESDIQSAEGF